MQTFIQVAEVWTPTADRTALEYHAGLYGAHQRFGRVSRALCFGHGEGLPGKAWATRQPVLSKDLQGDWFRRAYEASESGLTCAIAIPVFAGDFLLAVLVFFCADGAGQVGAIELWRHDPAQSPGLKLEDGYFGLAESLEWTARHTEFMRGHGLPGLAWASGMPEVLDDLGQSSRFLRRDDARRLGLTKGLALPFLAQAEQPRVLTFLSALGTPIARRFETWVPGPSGSALVFREGVCDSRPAFAKDFAGVALEPRASLLGMCWATGLPSLSSSIGTENSPIGASARGAGLDNMVALPLIEAGQLKAIVALYF